MISSKSDWYNVFNNHKENLRTIVSAYNNQELELFDDLSNEHFSNGLEIVSILNHTWFNAPDSSGIHYLPSWNALCSLCSESWVFEDEYKEVF